MSKNPTIVFLETGKVDIEICEIPIPQEGEMLIRTTKTVISTGTELTVLEGKDLPSGSNWEKQLNFPIYPGYNNVGVVIDVGKGLEKDWIGKKVATYGKHAQYVTANSQWVSLVQRDIPDEYAAFFTFAEIVLNGVRRGNIRLGDSVAVFGLGLLGHLAIDFSRMCGAKNVFAIDISDFRLRRVQKSPSIIPINSGREDVFDKIKELTRGRMVDVVIELTGVASLIPNEFKVLRSQGKFVVLSSPRGKTSFDFHDLCNGPSFTIIGAHNNSHPAYETLDNPWTLMRDAEFFFDLVADGELNIEKLISHKVHYFEAAKMYQMLLEDRSSAMGIVLDWQ